MCSAWGFLGVSLLEMRDSGARGGRAATFVGVWCSELCQTHRDGPQPGQRGTRPPCTEPFVAESLAGGCRGGPRTKFHPRFSPVDPAVELKSGKLE